MLGRKFFRIREELYKVLFLAGDAGKLLGHRIMQICQAGFVFISVGFIIAAVFYLGFFKTDNLFNDPVKTFRLFFILLFYTKFIAEILKITRRKTIFWIVDGILLIWGFSLILVRFFNPEPESLVIRQFLGAESYMIVSAFLIFSKIYKIAELVQSWRIAPSLLFATSFLLVIFVGAGLLMLPRAHSQSLSFLEALFTSTSAVCVTGLIVVDTSTAFTMLGKTIIICLIQTGGLGIMAFTLFFGVVFTGSLSFRDSMVLKDLFSSERLGGMMRVLMKVMGLTFLIEFLGAVFIWFSVRNLTEDTVFFSVFHSISAFCNAGFSTLQDNLFEQGFRDNQLLSITIAFLIIFGGIGFPVLLFLSAKFYLSILYFFRKLTGIGKTIKEPLYDLNTRVVLLTTFLLLAGGTLLYYLFEKNTSLNGIQGIQKLVVSFFGSVSARTAGFNVADLTSWSYPTVFLIIFLMWIGASPGSTGGGIKTTTFFVALKTAFNFIRGKETIEIGHREIGMNTIIRVLSVIILSLLVIGAGFMGLVLSNPGNNPIHLLFETVSAYGTVGLSIVNTATLNSTGKIILICLMFIGRIGPLTLLSAMLIGYKRQYYKFPKQDLIIN